MFIYFGRCWLTSRRFWNLKLGWFVWSSPYFSYTYSPRVFVFPVKSFKSMETQNWAYQPRLFVRWKVTCILSFTILYAFNQTSSLTREVHLYISSWSQFFLRTVPILHFFGSSDKKTLIWVLLWHYCKEPKKSAIQKV